MMRIEGFVYLVYCDMLDRYSWKSVRFEIHQYRNATQSWALGVNTEQVYSPFARKHASTQLLMV